MKSNTDLTQPGRMEYVRFLLACSVCALAATAVMYFVGPRTWLGGVGIGYGIGATVGAAFAAFQYLVLTGKEVRLHVE